MPITTVHIARRLIEERSPPKHAFYQAGQRGELRLEAPVAAGAAE